MYKDQQRPIIYLDESGFKRNNCRPYGYAAKGQRCYGLFDWQGRNQTNAIGALYEGNLFAVGLFDCTVNGAVFDAWTEQMLIPNLPEYSVVVMDNAAFHKGEAQQLLEEKGHTVLWLPPYSPDLNPIERCWAMVKSWRRKWRLDDVDVLFERVLSVEN